jgi:hypothetical protein
MDWTRIHEDATTAQAYVGTGTWIQQMSPGAQLSEGAIPRVAGRVQTASTAGMPQADANFMPFGEEERADV